MIKTPPAHTDGADERMLPTVYRATPSLSTTLPQRCFPLRPAMLLKPIRIRPHSGWLVMDGMFPANDLGEVQVSWHDVEHADALSTFVEWETQPGDLGNLPWRLFFTFESAAVVPSEPRWIHPLVAFIDDPPAEQSVGWCSEDTGHCAGQLTDGCGIWSEEVIEHGGREPIARAFRGDDKGCRSQPWVPFMSGTTHFLDFEAFYLRIDRAQR